MLHMMAAKTTYYESLASVCYVEEAKKGNQGRMQKFRKGGGGGGELWWKMGVFTERGWVREGICTLPRELFGSYTFEMQFRTLYSTGTGGYRGGVEIIFTINFHHIWCC